MVALHLARIGLWTLFGPHHFMPDENDKPATKADISLLATKTELDCLDKKIDRVAAALVNTH